MNETTEHKATMRPAFGSVIGVRTDTTGNRLLLTVSAETTKGAQLSAEDCRKLAAYLTRQATELEKSERVARVSSPLKGLYDRDPALPLRGIDSAWEKPGTSVLDEWKRTAGRRFP
ncbi:hypothetical protein [Kitasatospora sp. McL0602]|uniref:hypothetical protein n=1 Tax=Kitasatospora sp. McL0602 TaxID=3439530 RepID=UPI003F8CD160